MFISIYYCYRENKGIMKSKGNCNFGFEMPSSEIAAYHLHRFLSITDKNR